MAIHVREKPPLRHSIDLQTPSGRRYRWGLDEPDPAKVFSGLRYSDIMPGGFEQIDVVLPRRSGLDHGDHKQLSTLRVLAAGGDVAGEYRLERTPRVSGEQMSVSPGGVGWQSHLSDDKSAREIYVDRDLSRWQGPAAQRKINLAATHSFADPAVQPDKTTGQPTLRTAITGPWSTGAGRPISDAWYDAHGIPIGSLRYAWLRGANVQSTDANWSWLAGLSSDDLATVIDATANLRAAGPGSGTLTATAIRKFALLHLSYANVAAGGNNVEYPIDWYGIAVYGTHGLAKRGSAPEGLFASDVIANAVRRWAPRLHFTEGVQGTIQPSGFVIEQLAFLDATSAAEIVKQANRFHLRDWAVWEDKTFWYHERGARGKRWRARIAPAQLEETGPQVDRLWESVIVSYQDVDGTARTVGPPGSGADVESALLKDSDPENPANELGITRRQQLQAGVLTAAGATEIGARFLEEQKLLDSSGRAQLVGHVEDDHGVLWPYSKVRAGDQISFVDSSDQSYRRIVKTEKDYASRTCTVDLDSPPEGMEALLERLGVVVAPLGVG